MGTNRAAIVSLVEATKDKELQRIAKKIINKESITFMEYNIQKRHGMKLRKIGMVSHFIKHQWLELEIKKICE